MYFVVVIDFLPRCERTDAHAYPLELLRLTDRLKLSRVPAKCHREAVSTTRTAVRHSHSHKGECDCYYHKLIGRSSGSRYR